MSPVQAPVCATDYPRTSIDAALIRVEPLHPDSLYAGTLLEGEDAAMRKRAESVSQHKLLTYQAAAVVSSVLAGVESQLLVFFKSSPDFTQQHVPVILQYLLVLTYIALIFSVGTTINSLILTKNFGNVPMLAGRFQEKIRSMCLPTFEFPPLRRRPSDDIAPWQWRLLESHWLFTLVISMLCLPAQILLYIWTQERNVIKVAVSVAGVFAMLPILHFLPIRRRRIEHSGKRNVAPLPRYSSWDVPQPAPMPLPPASYTVRSAYKMNY